MFLSWGNERAKAYRQLNDIPGKWGTAVNVQSMVFGNMDDESGTGVAFTRDPSTGARIFYGEYLRNAQGEDVVAGIRTPQPLNQESSLEERRHLPTLESEMPGPYGRLLRIQRLLERHASESGRLTRGALEQLVETVEVERNEVGREAVRLRLGDDERSRPFSVACEVAAKDGDERLQRARRIPRAELRRRPAL